MSDRDPDHLAHLRHAIERVREWASDGRDVFLEDERTQWAVLRGMHTLTESASALSGEVKLRHPDIDWRGLAGYRNIVVHGYLNQLSLERSWEYIEQDLPLLAAAVNEEYQRLRVPRAKR